MACKTTTSPSHKEDHDEMDPSIATVWHPASYAISELRRSKKAFDRHIVIVLNVPLTDRKYVKGLLSSGVQAVDLDIQH